MVNGYFAEQADAGAFEDAMRMPPSGDDAVRGDDAASDALLDFHGSQIDAGIDAMMRKDGMHNGGAASKEPDSQMSDADIRAVHTSGRSSSSSGRILTQEESFAKLARETAQAWKEDECISDDDDNNLHGRGAAAAVGSSAADNES